MGSLRRLATISFAVALLFALTSLPTLRGNRTTGSAFTPAIAWAGGSPDETLKPPTPPPPQQSAKSIGYRDRILDRPTDSAGTLSPSEWLRLLYRAALASVLRI